MKRILIHLSGLHDLIMDIQKLLLCIILSVIIFLSFGQVVARNVFSQGYFWIDIFLRHGVIWVTFLSASLATYYRQHIKIDVLSHFITGPLKTKTLSVGISVFQIIICAFLFWGAMDYVEMLRMYPKYVFDLVPEWGLRLIVPYSFFMMMISSVFHIGALLTNSGSPEMGLGAIDLTQE